MVSLSDSLRASLRVALSEPWCTSVVVSIRELSSAAALVCATLDASAPDSDVMPLTLQELSLLSLLSDVVVARALLPALVVSRRALVGAVRVRFARTARALPPLGGSVDDMCYEREKDKDKGTETEAEAEAEAEAGGDDDDLIPRKAAESGSSAGLLATTFASLLTHPMQDVRFLDRALPDALAALCVAQRGGDVSNANEGRDAAIKIHAALPARILAQGYMSVVSGGAGGNVARAAGEIASGGPQPDAPAPLRAAAAAALSRLLLRSDGAAGVLDAFFAGADAADEGSLDRASDRAVAVLSTPPLEIGSAEKYWAALAPQLQKLLRTAGGPAARRVAGAASRVAARSAARGGPPAAAAIDAALFYPLTAFTINQAEANASASASPALLLADEDAVAAAVEDANSVARAEPLTHARARALLKVAPALLSLATAAGASRLRAGLGAAAREALVLIIRALPPAEATAALWNLARLKACVDVDVDAVVVAAPFLYRAPTVAFVFGDSAGFELRRFAMPVDEKGEEEGGGGGAA